MHNRSLRIANPRIESVGSFSALLRISNGSPADGSLVSELELPKDALIAAFVRDGKPQIGRGKSRLRAKDHVVVVAMPSSVDEVHRVLG